MGRAVMCLVVAMAGCVESEATECGAVLCAPGMVCLADTQRCVRPGQLAECAELAEGAECVTEGLPGRCTDGACTPISCGNQIVEAGEVCDDGNQLSGDGCSGTCTSEEICGNGIVDVAVGEGCDCGTEDDVSSLCTRPNSADLMAECDTTCTPRFCGDGVVNTIEQCDGSVPAGASCESFGYYHGEVTCALCQLSPAQCFGRCGDGVIDLDANEFCDGQLPDDASCLALGFDVGALECGPSCAPVLQVCERLGLVRVLDHGDDVVTQLWGGGGYIGALYASGDAFAVEGRSAFQAPGTYTRVFGTETSVMAAGPTEVASFDPDSETWTTETAPWPSTATAVDAWASDQLGVFVITSTGSMFWKSGGSWTLMFTPSLAQASFASTWSTPILINGDNTSTFDGTSWVPFTDLELIDSSPIRLAADDATGRLWVRLASGALYRQLGAGWELLEAPTIVIGAFDGIRPGREAIWKLETGPGAGSSEIYTASKPHTEPIVVVLESRAMFADNGLGVPYSVSLTGDLVFSPRGHWLADIRTPFGDMEFRHAPGGLLTFATPGQDTRAYSPQGEYVSYGEQCARAAVTADDTLYCLKATEVIDGANTIAVSGATDLWLARDAESIAVAGDHVFAHRDAAAGAWTITTPTLVFHRLIGDGAGEFFATAVADGDSDVRLYHYDGAWNVVDPTLVIERDSLVVTADSVFTLSDGVVMQYARATGSMTALPDGPGSLTDLDGPADDDLFAATSDVEAVTPLWRWDGSAWSPVRLPPNLENVVGIYAQDDVVMVKTIMIGSVVIARAFRLERTADW